jgi:hypothetical protein
MVSPAVLRSSGCSSYRCFVPSAGGVVRRLPGHGEDRALGRTAPTCRMRARRLAAAAMGHPGDELPPCDWRKAGYGGPWCQTRSRHTTPLDGLPRAVTISHSHHPLEAKRCVGPRSAQELVATLVRSIFAQPDAVSTHAQHAPDRRTAPETLPGRGRAAGRCAGKLLAFTATNPVRHEASRDRAEMKGPRGWAVAAAP